MAMKVNFNSNLQHQKKVRDKFGCKLDEASRFSYVAHFSLTAFNVIARVRSYTPAAMPLHGSSIHLYFKLYEAPCELHIF